VEFFGFVVGTQQPFPAVIKLCAENKALEHSWPRVKRLGTVEDAQDARQGAVDCIGHRAGDEGPIGLSEPAEPIAQLNPLRARGAPGGSFMVATVPSIAGARTWSIKSPTNRSRSSRSSSTAMRPFLDVALRKSPMRIFPRANGHLLGKL
jgi:hypothetical protein